MKKLVLICLALLGLAMVAQAATPTPTFTPTPTATPTMYYPPFPLPDNLAHPGIRLIMPIDFFMVDGLTRLTATVAAGATFPWLAQSMSFTSAVFSTGTCSARFGMIMPNNYDPDKFPLKLWAYMQESDSTAASTTAFCVNFTKLHYDRLTSTAVTFLGTTVSVQAMARNGLKDSMISLVQLPVPTGVSQVAAGDLLGFQLIRAGGTAGNVSIFAIEPEYDPRWMKQP